MKTFAKMMAATLVALALMCVAVACDLSDFVAIAIYVSVLLALSLALGVLDVQEDRRSDKRADVKREELAAAA